MARGREIRPPPVAIFVSLEIRPFRHNRTEVILLGEMLYLWEVLLYGHGKKLKFSAFHSNAANSLIAS
jgi:hypothetical protein